MRTVGGNQLRVSAITGVGFERYKFRPLDFFFKLGGYNIQIRDFRKGTLNFVDFKISKM